jgi:multidrug efflux pump
LLGLFFVPLYFVTILRLFRVKPLYASGKTENPDEEPKPEQESEEEELINV